MEYNNLKTMCEWERQKAIFLMKIANDLKMDYNDSYGELAVNNNSGYTYLWCEDYPFSLYMPISCNLNKTNVFALWNNPDNENEEEMQLQSDTTLQDLYDWVETLEK